MVRAVGLPLGVGAPSSLTLFPISWQKRPFAPLGSLGEALLSMSGWWLPFRHVIPLGRGNPDSE